MKKVLLLLLILCITIPSAPVLAEDDPYTMGNPDISDWFEWDWPDDANAYGTPIDASKYMHKPAGKHGFLRVDGSKMYFEDGTEARFWGANINTAFEQSKEQIDEIADRVARSGYNMVRFHAIDSHSIAVSIYGKKGTYKQTTYADPESLDRFHYFVYALKERGVYTNIDLLTYKNYLPGDGLPPDVSSLKGAGYASFDANLIESQKKFADSVLTPVNPYTGLALKDDPAVAIVNIANEKTIWSIAGYEINDYYQGGFQSKFNHWLAAKYKTVDELRAAWQEEGKEGLPAGQSFEDGTVLCPVKNLRTNNYSKQKQDDIVNFMYDTQHDYYADMYDYIKNTIGYKNLVSGQSMGATGKVPSEMPLQRETVDVMSMNGYKSHPSGVHWPGNTLSSWISPLLDEGDETGVFYLNRAANIPLFIGEWNSCPPGHHSPELFIQFAVLSRIYDINPMNFSLLASLLPEKNAGQTSYFESYPVGMHTSIGPVAAMLFHRDNIEQFEDEYNMVTYKQDFIDLQDSRQMYATPKNLWPYGTINVKYPDIMEEDDASSESGEGLYNMYKKSEKNEPQTSQMNWNTDTGLFRISTDYTDLAMGFVGGLTIDMKRCTFEIENQAATCAVTSATDKSFEETDSYLVALVGRSRNTGMTMDDETGSKVTNGGTGPQIMEPIKGYITVKIPEDIEIYALDSSGKRTEKISYELTEEGYKRFYVGAKYKTAYYEIAKTGGN